MCVSLFSVYYFLLNHNCLSKSSYTLTFMCLVSLLKLIDMCTHKQKHIDMVYTKWFIQLIQLKDVLTFLKIDAWKVTTNDKSYLYNDFRVTFWSSFSNFTTWNHCEKKIFIVFYKCIVVVETNHFVGENYATKMFPNFPALHFSWTRLLNNSWIRS